jgi:hypothetical protein
LRRRVLGLEDLEGGNVLWFGISWDLEEVWMFEFL